MNRKVYFYTRAKPHPTGSGAQVRVYTNLRAYLDLGFEVEVVWFHAKEAPQKVTISHLNVTVVPIQEQPIRISSWKYLRYILGISKDAVLDQLFAFRKQVQGEARKREQATPGAIHHFEYLDLASAAVGLPPGRYVWSNHDFDSERFNLIQGMRREAGYSKKSGWVRAVQYRRMQSAEKWTASACRLVLTIADHETTLLRNSLGGANINHLPMSWPDETPSPRTRGWMADGKLLLFHLGSLNSLVPYSSMRFILEDVFPKISKEYMERIELWVAGQNMQGEYCQKILQLASSWPNVRFLGYVENIESLFGLVDLQVVGSQFASGLRTRIIESFARGVPGISTVTAAIGVVGLENHRNILLADNAEVFAHEMIAIFENPECLQHLSLQAQGSYRLFYGRDVQARTLHNLIETYL